LELAKKAPQFRPVRGDTEEKAGDAFLYREPDGTAYVAAFNFSKTDAAVRVLPMKRLGLPAGRWKLRDLWTGEERSVEGDLELRLPPTDCALVRLTRAR
ncbi:MAG TPA: hypothetical protein VGE01_02470, partial [Fimbriimonas sp.]